MNRRRTRRFRLAEQLEPKYCLSAVVFIDHTINTSDSHWIRDGNRDIGIADLDGDGDLDIFTPTERYNSKVVWHENVDGNGSFEERIIGDGNAPILTVVPDDLDGDGDLDVVVGRSGWIGLGGIYWYENSDGLGSFSEAHFVPLEGCSLGPSGNQGCPSVPSVLTADLDGDGDVDLISTSRRTISWHENIDGKGLFGEQHVIDPFNASVRSVYAADLDGDGDVDVLCALPDSKIAWYENDGQGGFQEQQEIWAVGVNAVHGADLDSDGDEDVLSASGADNTIAWYENADGEGGFAHEREISSDADLATSVYAADLDGDGDLDVLWASSAGCVAWHENLDGRGFFGHQRLITELADGIVRAADLDGDDDVDVISHVPGGSVVWHENRLLADSNDDGIFDSSDLVMVFQVGKYEDGIDGNASFDEGDWNGDGDFDSSDLVAAFQAGHYVSEPQPPASDVAAAIDAMFADEEAN